MILRRSSWEGSSLPLLYICILISQVSLPLALASSVPPSSDAAGRRLPTFQTRAQSVLDRPPLEQLASNRPLNAPETSQNGDKRLPTSLAALLNAVEVMQSQFFQVDTGTWPDAIDWTAAVMGTHISATLSTLTSSIDDNMLPCDEYLAWENVLNRYFSHTSAFYFGENAFSLRNQAYDDMLWVVLGWLENIKFVKLHSRLHYPESSSDIFGASWHGLQFSPAAAHRARLFYDLASHGWDTSLCSGGMIWNPHLTPYKNAITNELFISASIGMYLYFPGDDNDSPFSIDITGDSPSDSPSGPLKPAKPHNPRHLENAIKAYKWLQSSNMTSTAGLYVDGFHIRGWHRHPGNGTTHPGTGKCDERNEMVYTYNQGVLLSGQRGLWIATGARSYLAEGHALVAAVLRATGWWSKSSHSQDSSWAGLGRSGVMEEFCDSAGSCSQNGHTFKGIFFHHLAEFCRPLRPEERDFMADFPEHGYEAAESWHAQRCAGYGGWIAHNAVAAFVTKNEKGKFGMWWGRSYPDFGEQAEEFPAVDLPAGAVDYRNMGVPDGSTSDDGISWRDGGSRPSSSSAQKGAAQQRVALETRDRAITMEPKDVNDRGRGRTVETQSGGVAALRALWQWEAAGRFS